MNGEVHHCNNCETFFGDTNTVVTVSVTDRPDKLRFCCQECFLEYFKVMTHEYY